MTRLLLLALCALLPGCFLFGGGYELPRDNPLFDGESLAGWTVVPGGTWTVEDGVLVGRNTSSDPRHGILLLEQQLHDFAVEVEFKAVVGNSGLYFRCERVDGPVGVHGFQAEIDADRDVGGLYETGGRAWVVRPSAEDVARWFERGGWNRLLVVANGPNVRVYVNGKLSATLEDDPGRLFGHLGLQLHGGQDVEVHFRRVVQLDPRWNP